MKITHIQLITKGNKTTLSAEISFEKQNAETLYFTVNKKYADFVFPDASAFLAGVLLPSMKRKENLFLEGSVSETLLKNTRKIFSLIKKWNIGLSPILIKAEKKQKDIEKPKFVGCFFSAGVDSFYTYLKNKKNITHFIIVHGFDIDLKNKELFAETVKNIKKIAKEANIEVIPVETDIKDIIETHLEWDWSHGGALAAVGLFLRKGLKKVYISGAVRKDQLFPYGTHPSLDILWSTEKLTFIHEGTEYARLEKIMYSIAKSSLALKYLRVCSRNGKGVYNCSHCFKCLKTMIDLICANALQKTSTFEKKINLELVKNMYYNYKLKYHYLAEANLAILRKQQREPELQEAIEESLRRSRKLSVKRRVTETIAGFDKKYNNRRLYRWVFALNKNNERKLVFKVLAARGVIK